MFEYSYKRFTPSMKQKVMDFFKALSFSSREMLSIDGIDPRTLYHEFREGWFETCPFCLFKDQKVIAICKVSNWRDGTYLSCLVVEEANRKQGFGSKVVKYAMALSMLNGAKKMYLEVKKENSIGIHFFKSLGFAVSKKMEMTYQMEKRLI